MTVEVQKHEWLVLSSNWSNQGNFRQELRLAEASIDVSSQQISPEIASNDTIDIHHRDYLEDQSFS